MLREWFSDTGHTLAPADLLAMAEDFGLYALVADRDLRVVAAGASARRVLEALSGAAVPDDLRRLLTPESARAVASLFDGGTAAGTPVLATLALAEPTRCLARALRLTGAAGGDGLRLLLFTPLNAGAHAPDDLPPQITSLLDTAQDLVFVTDLDGAIVDANASACRVSGYTRGELLGHDIRALTRPGPDTTLEGGIGGRVEQSMQLFLGTQLRAKDGTTVPIEAKEKIITYGGKRRVMAIARDTSERKAAERMVLKAIFDTEARERQRFAEALHDDVAPLLASLKLYIGMLAERGDDPATLRAAVPIMAQIADQATAATRRTAQGLASNVAGDFGLMEGLRDFVAKINFTGALTIEIDDPDGIQITGETASILLGVFKELIHNTRKHAGAGKARVEARRAAGQTIIIEYADDGRGFDLRAAAEASQGMGLRNIRAKLRSIGAQAEQIGAGHPGFRIRITLP